jgi:hypothetical protein
MQIVHCNGNKHSNTDGLSRIPDRLDACYCYNAGGNLESLPCGGCNYCTRACQQWERFSEDVDNVVPLAVKVIIPEPRQIAEVLKVEYNTDVQTDGLSC